jgi:hypothetical protein
MFHYAFYKYLKLAGFNVFLDKNSPQSRFQHQKHETFRLDYFQLKDLNFAAEDDIYDFLPKQKSSYLLPFSQVVKTKPVIEIIDIFIYKILNKIKRRLGLSTEFWYEHDKHSKDFYHKKLTKKTRVYMSGRYQEFYYIENMREGLLEDFKFNAEMPENVKECFNKIEKTNSVAIHIRRGDYSGTKEFDVCSIKYYENAVNYILEKEKDALFFIFSDDIEWVKNNFIFLERYCVIDNREYDKSDYFDLYLMSSCKHNIIPNSTFSWWGAWLNQNPNKIVICPEKWNGLGLIYTDEICPVEWKRVAIS